MLAATSSFPRDTSTSVSASPRQRRCEIASRWLWLLVLALMTRVSSSMRSDSDSTGPATAIDSSSARVRMTIAGALAMGASRCAMASRDGAVDFVDQPAHDVVESATCSSKPAEPAANRSVTRRNMSARCPTPLCRDRALQLLDQVMTGIHGNGFAFRPHSRRCGFAQWFRNQAPRRRTGGRSEDPG